MTLKQYIKKKSLQLVKAPQLFWAKKFDKVAHIPTALPEYKTLCGSHAALLGTNYAADHVNVCKECARIEFELINKS